MSAISYETYAGDRVTGDGRHVAVSVDGVRLAAAVNLRQRYSATDPDATRWYVILCVPGIDVRLTEVRDEAHALAWLAALAELRLACSVGETVSVDEEPIERITELDIIADAEEMSAAELDDGEHAYWDEVRECCGGTDFWCSHYLSYPPVAVAERW